MDKICQYETITRLSIDDFNKAYEDKNNMHDNNKNFIVVGENGVEYKLKRKSLRYQIFNKNTNCVDCGLIGTHYLIQRNKENESNVTGRYHANLYGANQSGEDILITKDHIIRKREGGKNHIDNLQTMCCVCNNIIKN